MADPLQHAEQALARLDLAGEIVPSLDWFIYAFVRKEAVISSQIEGAQASLIDLLSFEAEEKASPNPDVEEVCNYLEALAYARDQIADERGSPLSMRLLNGNPQALDTGRSRSREAAAGIAMDLRAIPAAPRALLMAGGQIQTPVPENTLPPTRQKARRHRCGRMRWWPG